MRAAAKGLDDSQLDTPYREAAGQCGRSCITFRTATSNAYVRLKLALTEDKPTIKPYNEAAWAELADAKSAPIEVSQTLLDSVHTRWDRLWRSFEARTFRQSFSFTRNMASAPLIGCCLFTSGTENITPRISRNFASKKAGKKSGKNSFVPARYGVKWRSAVRLVYDDLAQKEIA